MNHGLHEWPQRGPSQWLAKWENLMTRAEQFSVSFDNWLTDVNTVWKTVSELVEYFQTVKKKVIEGKKTKYTPASISLAI